MRSDYQERRIKLNSHVTVTLKSERYKDSDMYRNTISVVSVRASSKPFSLLTRDELTDLIKNIDLEEEQQSLLADLDFGPRSKG